MGSLFFYLTVFLIVFILVRLAVKFGIHEDKYSRTYYILYGLAAIILILVSGLRHQVGTDYQSYINMFLESKDVSIGTMSNSRIELGYMILNKVLSLVFSSPVVAIIATSAIIVIFMFMGMHALMKNKANLPYGILIFMLTLYPQSFNMVRQAMAISICFYALTHLFDRHFIKYLILILLASSFHSTAIVCLPLYFLYNKNKNKIVLKNATLTILLVIVLNFGIIIWLLQNIAIFSKYLSYIDVYSGSISLVSLLKVMPICILLAFTYRQLVVKDDKNKLLIYLIFYSCILMQLASYIMYFDRLALYFSAAYYIVLPHVIDICKNKETRLVVKLAIVGYYLYDFILKYYLWGFSEIFPYQSIL